MTNITQKIEARLAENKNGVKTFASHQFAEARGEKLSAEFNQYNGTDTNFDHIVVFLPHVKRWTVIFNLTQWSARSNTGTYLGWFAQKGFFSI